ncbi:HigA family addiction module antitoxin [Ancylobacter sp. MQZ15Z-1]|uniref:HigA family addiction module antitoxin n=1 Tax=Ancylobacter mangrovi TaxID=2972472 RepID=A0A9X2PCE6_9HYPH|nr:HigA family addiction module antitoxin [Ancylobacter mangrovi]MCS0494341.1 HigA family addiction module antitoxin [Ancylobacter mangrovi]
MAVAADVERGWSPNWAVHPGEHLEEHLESRGLSQADFARLSALSPKLVSTIIAGKNPVTPETALRLERVLGVRAYIWAGLQAKWDIHQARLNEEAVADPKDWLKRFPIRELKERKLLPATTDSSVLLDEVLKLFGIGRISAYEAKVGALAVHHRQSRAYATSEDHIATWLLIGEAKAREMRLPEFDVRRFNQAVSEIRSLTTEPPEQFEPRMRALCRAAGVALILEKPLSKTCLFGSARWLDGNRAIIQMSLRMKTNDHFWWTFFHEAAHVVLHRGRSFVDDKAGEADDVEIEADAWANNTLFGRVGLDRLLEERPRSAVSVARLANEFGLHPGIIVGALQHHGALPYTHLNAMKARFIWADETTER